MVEVRQGRRAPQADPGAPAPGAGVRRPRIVRQGGVVGLVEAAYSQLYRLLLLVTPLR
jgi:hypothetical protein